MFIVPKVIKWVIVSRHPHSPFVPLSWAPPACALVFFNRYYFMINFGNYFAQKGSCTSSCKLVGYLFFLCVWLSSLFNLLYLKEIPFWSLRVALTLTWVVHSWFVVHFSRFLFSMLYKYRMPWSNVNGKKIELVCNPCFLFLRFRVIHIFQICSSTMP